MLNDDIPIAKCTRLFPFALSATYDLERQQSILKNNLILQDDHPDWSITFKPGDDTYHLEGVQGLRYIGGVDLSFIIENNEDAIASLIVLSYPELKVVYEDHAKVKLTLPYIAGYLAFREVEPLLGLIESLRTNRPELMPQVIMVDGCGALHPRGFGLASHLGLVSNIPTIGCSKNYLVIHGDGPLLGAQPTELKYIFRNFVADNKDAHGLMPLKGEVSGKVYGAALSAATTKSADGAQNPIFVSIGHRVSLETAVALVRACSLYRIPEPIRQADLKSRTQIKKWCLEQGKQQ
ncbi:endonuclease V-domain-containing protein [Gamsiella multidivaricata]|uniref:endonuclease V-domain-containing protein n=1 Tax=Gamsiella multidivaricata TaxID=101098 RepID=UPI00221E7E39|nr:endonuclease V-domain-containing protein [Gamsiella multidivaricata]KAI7828777.1 endonuclease V-domain-containing protein [Gamsiella multidivaricata]